MMPIHVPHPLFVPQYLYRNREVIIRDTPEAVVGGLRWSAELVYRDLGYI